MNDPTRRNIVTAVAAATVATALPPAVTTAAPAPAQTFDLTATKVMPSGLIVAAYTVAGPLKTA